ncbi:MAG: PAP2 family protein [Bacteroidota bacterium]
MSKLIAKIISIVFNPLLMPTYGLLILLNSETYFAMLPFHAKKVIFIIVFITTCLLPLAFLPLFMFQNLLKSFEMYTIKERIIPLATIGILYFIGYLIMYQMDVPSTLANILLAGAITIFLLFLITLRWKISAHMAGIGALTGTILAFSYTLETNLINFLLASIFIAGLVGTSRLILKHHTPPQIYTGFGLGLTVLVFTFVFF